MGKIEGLLKANCYYILATWEYLTWLLTSVNGKLPGPVSARAVPIQVHLLQNVQPKEQNNNNYSEKDGLCIYTTDLCR